MAAPESDTNGFALIGNYFSITLVPIFSNSYFSIAYANSGMLELAKTPFLSAPNILLNYRAGSCKVYCNDFPLLSLIQKIYRTFLHIHAI